MGSPENILTINMIQMEQVLFMSFNTHTLSTIIEKGDHEFEFEEQKGGIR